MKIIISPAKKMVYDEESLDNKSLPYFIDTARMLADYFKEVSFEEAKAVWKCNDDIAKLNYERFNKMDFKHKLMPALFAYEGIQYKYLCPSAFTTTELDYIEEHLIILSGLYGALKAFDGVVSYRLEMQAVLKDKEIKSLYDFWGGKIADHIFTSTDTILNLASKEYSKVVTKYAKDNKIVNCIFGELKDGKVVEKGTQVKMARGEAVRFMAEHNYKTPEDLKAFNRLGYSFCEARSSQNEFVFIKG